MPKRPTRPYKALVGERIARARARAGLTATEAASKIGWAWRQWSRYEAGQAEPGAEKLALIRAALGCTADELLPAVRR